METKISDNLAIIASSGPVSAATATSDIVSMANWNKIMAVVVTGASLSAGTITLFKSDDTSGTSTVALSTQAVTTANTAKEYILQADNDKFSSTYPLVGVKYVSADTNVGLTTTLIFGEGKHQPAIDNDLASVTVVS
jgi:hypothetical protein